MSPIDSAIFTSERTDVKRSLKTTALGTMQKASKAIIASTASNVKTLYLFFERNDFT